MTKKSEMIGFKTTPEIRTRLETIAKKEDRSISYVINKILERELTAGPVIVESVEAVNHKNNKEIHGDIVHISLGKK